MYESPKVSDYGDYRQITAAMNTGGTEDGASKLLDNHFMSVPM